MRILVAGVVVLVVLLGVGCGGDSPEKDDSAKTPQQAKQDNAPTVEETTAPRERTETTTGFEFSVGKTPMDEDDDDEESPEDVLGRQYEHINSGDYESAYALFDRRSRREVSFARYRAFFEENAPYSVTDYVFSPAEMDGDSASVDAAFTVTSASGVERLERTQEFVREDGDWRVVMRPDQLAAFAAVGDETGTDSAPDSVGEAGDLDCDDFDFQEDAQAVYEQDTSDPNGLDGPVGEGYTGEQGEACENLPSRIATQSPTPARESQSPRPRPAPQPTPNPAPAAPSPTPVAPPQSAAPAAPKGDVDCSDFSSSDEAQGYLLPGDPYRLDADNDGQACDSLS